jgi:50S ribosomal subunit-associated GTPase HflX
MDRAASVERDVCGTIRAVFLSAATGDGIEFLREAIAERVRDSRSVSAESLSTSGIPTPAAGSAVVVK